LELLLIWFPKTSASFLYALSFITYYAAYIIDPKGRNIEAVCMKPDFWGEEWSWGVWTAVVGVMGVGLGAIWN